jgi:ribosomal protein S18 acetylase RimI-like enzyme
VGYLDNVVTMPEFRGRGVATATVGRAIEASRASGDNALFLLTEEDNPARRLYERIGFRVRAKVESFTWPLSEELGGA